MLFFKVLIVILIGFFEEIVDCFFKFFVKDNWGFGFIFVFELLLMILVLILVIWILLNVFVLIIFFNVKIWIISWKVIRKVIYREGLGESKEGKEYLLFLGIYKLGCIIYIFKIFLIKI